jgi:hypothetical protein
VKIDWTSVFKNKMLWVCLVLAAVIGSLGVVLNRSQLVVIGAVYTLVCIGYFAWYTGSSSNE